MSDTIWAMEDTPLVEGDEPVFVATYAGVTTVSVASGTMAIYKNGSNTNLASTHLVSGDSLSASGNQVTLKKITALEGGNKYTIVVGAAEDGVFLHRKHTFAVQKKGSMR